MKRRIALAPLAVGACLAACQSQPMRSLPVSFAALDDDGDGRLSRIEAADAPPILAWFHYADADGSRSLDRQEFLRAAASGFSE